jgi:hypothetical protein
MKNTLALSAAAVALLWTPGARAGVVYDGGSPDGFGGLEATQYIEAENFALSTAANVNDAHVYIEGDSGISAWEGVANYYLFANNGGTPGTVLASGAGTGLTTTDTGIGAPTGGDIYKLSFNFPSFAATAGTEYFFGIHLATDYNDRDDIYWGDTSSTASNPSESSYLGTMDNWESFGETLAFQLTSSAAIPEPSTWAMMLLGFAGLGYAGYRGRRSAVAAAH